MPAAVARDTAPRIANVPGYVSSAGAEACELAESFGLVLDPWQRLVLQHSLGERVDGKWAAFETAVIVGRQNGKGSILEARELAGLFLLDESLILHSAHQFKTAAEGFRRIRTLIEESDWASRRIKRITAGHGDECIELMSGQRLRFVARSRTSGRGFSGDLVILDEAFELDSEDMAALLPTLSARPNPQVWYASSAGMSTSTQLAFVRERGMAGGDPGLLYLEWSVPDGTDLDDRDGWARANPALGIRRESNGTELTEEFIERERRALDGAVFARERLGIWEPPAEADRVISAAEWDAIADPQSAPLLPVSFAIDADPDQAHAAIAFAGRRSDGREHVEVLEHRQGLGWVVPRLRRARDRAAADGQELGPVTVDPRSTAGSLISDLEADGFEVSQVKSAELAAACASFLTAVLGSDGLEDVRIEATLRHRSDGPLDEAVAGARVRTLGDGWAWGRKTSMVSICPLVAVTLARWSFLASEGGQYDAADSFY